MAAPATTEFAKRHTLQPGDVVSFKHHGFLLSSKRPKFPVLYRVRTDISWEAVAQNWKEGKSVPTGTCALDFRLIIKFSIDSYSFVVTPIRRPQRKNKPVGYWHNAENRRRFLEAFAKEMGFDPLTWSNWKNLHATLVAKGVSRRYGNFLVSLTIILIRVGQF